MITVKAQAGTEGRLFGSVTTADIVAAVQAQTGIELDRRKLHLDEPIKSIGTHQVPVRLHADVEFPVTVEVVARCSAQPAAVRSAPSVRDADQVSRPW